MDEYRQIGLFDYQGNPDYQGSFDEIIRYSIENRFTNLIGLDECCGEKPHEMFRSDTEYFVRCPICGNKTKYYKHLYQAKQAWNRREVQHG